MLHKNSLHAFFASLAPSLKAFRKSDPLRLAGATAFFTSFALPPIVFIMIQLVGSLTGRRTAGRALLERIAGTLGDDAAKQVRIVLTSIVGVKENWYVLVAGFLFLVFVATTLFAVIRNSMNQLWSIKPDDKPGFLYYAANRGIAFALILLAGILLLVDMMTESVNMIAGDYLKVAWSAGASYVNSILSNVIGLIVICIWFVLLFRFLGDGRPKWKPAIASGILTGVLFKAGKILLWFLLIKNNIGQYYGASGSLVLVLLFVFYSSFIFYFGVCFVQVYSNKLFLPIVPIHKAYRYRTEVIPDDALLG